jgi:Vitamin K-dependent gamma-carboxylase
MIVDAGAAQRAMEVLAALAVMQGTLELLATRRVFADDGVWQWRTLRPDAPWLSWALAYRPFLVLLAIRIVAAMLLLAGVRWGVAPALWVTSLLVSVRFRGTSNGGSDMMLMVVLSALVVAHLGASRPAVVSAALLYVAAQSLMSYFIAGVVKAVNAPWRQGTAMRSFVRTPHFGVPAAIVSLFDSRAVSLIVSWGVIVFECAAPLALLDPRVCVAYMSLAALFHLGNVAVFGLNRFLLAWAASWPALLYASSLAR